MDYHVDEDGGLSVDGKPVAFVRRGTMALLIKFVAMGCVFLDCNTESLMLKGATKILTNSIYTNGRYLLYCEDFRAAVNAKLNDENFVAWTIKHYMESKPSAQTATASDAGLASPIKYGNPFQSALQDITTTFSSALKQQLETHEKMHQSAQKEHAAQLDTLTSRFESMQDTSQKAHKAQLDTLTSAQKAQLDTVGKMHDQTVALAQKSLEVAEAEKKRQHEIQLIREQAALVSSKGSMLVSPVARYPQPAGDSFSSSRPQQGGGIQGNGFSSAPQQSSANFFGFFESLGNQPGQQQYDMPTQPSSSGPVGGNPQQQNFGANRFGSPQSHQPVQQSLGTNPFGSPQSHQVALQQHNSSAISSPTPSFVFGRQTSSHFMKE